MFDIGWGELLLIGIVALVAIGPKELPTVLRTLGQWMGKLRRMASEFQNQFQEAMREAEMADLKKQVDEMTSQAQSYANFDPVGEVRREFESAQQQIESAIADKPTVETSSPVAATEGGTPAIVTSASAEPAMAPRTDADAAAPVTAPAEPPSGGSDPGTQDAGGKPA
jgi:sec-independent protein translocase protein TatB